MESMEKECPGIIEDYERFTKIHNEVGYIFNEMQLPGFAACLSVIIEDYNNIHHIDVKKFFHDLEAMHNECC